MADVQTFRLPHYEDYPIYVALFKDVTNAEFLRSQLLEANPEFDYAFLDATMILGATHLLAATQLALQNHLTGRSKTRTPHSETVFRLHPNNNIGDSYRTFGMSSSTSVLLAIKIALPPPPSSTSSSSPAITAESVSAHLREHVKGQSIPISTAGDEIGTFADVGKIRKVYKLDSGATRPGKKGGKKEVGAAIGESGANGVVDDDLERKKMEAVMLGIMALKGS